MLKKSHTYLMELLGAELNEEKNRSTFVFQIERIMLKEKEELTFLKDIHPEIVKEFTMTDDELIMVANIPESYRRYDELQKEDKKSRWLFAYQLVQHVQSHSFSRLNQIICPENIVYNRGLTPTFLYYGIMDSLPPVEMNAERVWLETKAAVAAVVDASFSYEDYLKYHETLDLKAVGASVMRMTNYSDLIHYLEEQLNGIDAKTNESIRMPKSKWQKTKWLTIGLGILFIPALIMSLSYFIIEKPRNEAFIESHEFFLGDQYSEVVTTLSPYKVRKMPFVVLYELAYSSVLNEKLEEKQKKNVLANITLHTDTEYLKYWIYIGRAEATKAIDIARSVEDGELIVFGLLKKREEIQADDKLSGEEKQQLLKEIDTEVEEYERLMEHEESTTK